MKLRIKKATLRKGYAYLAILSLIVNSFSPFFASYQYVYAEDLGAEESAVADSGDDGVADESSDEGDAKEEDAAPPEESAEPEEESNQEQSIPEETVTEPTDETQQEDILPDGVSDYRPEEPTETTETVTDTTDSLDPVVNIVEPKEEIDEVEKVCIGDDEQITESVKEDWTIDSEKGYAETKEKVKLGVKYIFPEDEKVTLTFTCLPEDEDDRDNLKIEKVKVSDLNLPDDFNTDAEFAYDITTDMADGTFEYDLTLPKPEGVEAGVSYIEKSVDEAKEDVKTEDIKLVDMDKLDQDDKGITAEDLDHFSIWISTFSSVTFSVTQTSYQQGEAVHVKAGGLLNDPHAYYTIKIRNPSDVVVSDNGCNNKNISELTHSYTLAGADPVSVGWKAQIYKYGSKQNCVDAVSQQGYEDTFFEVTAGTVITFPTSEQCDDSGRMEICHATRSPVHPYVLLNLPCEAIYGNGGHLVNNGSPRAGHELDILPVDGLCNGYIPSLCGNSVLDDGEECDYGVLNGTSSCTSACTWDSTCRDEMLANGSFEYPVFDTSQGWDIFANGMVPGWTAEWYNDSGNRPEVQIELHAGVTGWTAKSGNQYTELDSDWDGPDGGTSGEEASVFISQEFPTIVGNEYSVSWSYSARPGHSDNWLGVYVNETPVFDSTNIAGGVSVAWQDKTYTFTATGDLTKVSFAEWGTPDSYGMFLDDVRVECLGEDKPRYQCNETIYTANNSSDLSWLDTGNGNVNHLDVLDFGSSASADDPFNARTYYISRYNTSYLRYYDHASGLNEDVGATGIPSSFFTKLAFDKYGALFGLADDRKLYQLDTSSGHATLRGTVSGITAGGDIVFDENNALYLMGTDGNLYIVDQGTLNKTLIKSTGLNPVTGLAYVGGKFYISTSINRGTQSNVYVMDKDGSNLTPLNDEPQTLINDLSSCLPGEEAEPFCGDGKVNQESEECDPGITDARGVAQVGGFCTETCKFVPVYDGSHSCPSGYSEDFVDSLTLDSRQGISTPYSFLANKLYLLRASGTYMYTNNEVRLADPAYGTTDNFSTTRPDIGIWGTNRGVTSILGDLGLGMGVIEWDDDYNVDTDHTYEKLLQTTDPLDASFLISDWYSSWYGDFCKDQSCMDDNSGTLGLDIYECVPNASVQICKVDQNQEPQANWKVVLRGTEPLQSLFVRSHNDAKDGNEIKTSDSFSEGDYVVRGLNEYLYRPGTLGAEYSDSGYSKRAPADAVYIFGDPAPWVNVMHFDSPLTGYLGLMVNDTPTDWGYFSPDHKYYLGYEDYTGTFDFTIKDDVYTDNSGGIDVDIYNGWVGITGDDGCATFDDVPFGTYYIDETMQNNWENVSGLGEVSVGSARENFTVVNREDLPITIVATKIVCDSEADLPNWGDGPSNNITEITAQRWIKEHPSCHLEEGWKFQWGDDGDTNPGDDVFGEAAGWNTFGPTDVNGQALAVVEDFGKSSQMKIREVLQKGYIPFTYTTNDNHNVDNVSAEIYCDTDVLNYDNDDRITNPQYGQTYYCVAFNTPETGSIQGRKFEDLNANGVKESTESFADNWLIRLYDSAWSSVDSMNTGDDTTPAGNVALGQYRFVNLPYGTYYICEVQQLGWKQTDPGFSEGFANLSGAPDEYPRCRRAIIDTPNELVSGKSFGNAQLGDIHGYKWHDINGDGVRNCVAEDIGDDVPEQTMQVCRPEPYLSGWEIFIDENGNGIRDGDERNTLTSSDPGDDFGWYWFDNLPDGSYRICETLQEGWVQTHPVPNCYDVNLPDTNPFRLAVSVNQVVGPEYKFGNYMEPTMSIAKFNDTLGADTAIGDQVMFTIVVTADDNNNVDILTATVRDLFSEGFDYIEDSWTAKSDERGDLKGLGLMSKPSYSSPGDWEIGDLVPGEVVTLTYLAEVTSVAGPGLYKDIAWVFGDDGLDNRIIGDAETGVDDGYLSSDKFVGTVVSVIADNPSPNAKAEVDEEEVEEEVLGSSTVRLPATGASTVMTFISVIALFMGVLVVAFSKRKKYAGILVIPMLFFLAFTTQVNAEETGDVFVRLEKPELLVNAPFKLSFVVMDARKGPADLSAQCWKDGPTAGWEAFGSLIPISAGGGTAVCDVTSGVLNANGGYDFKVIVDGVESNVQSTTYDNDGPDKPKYIGVDRKSDCKYEVEFKTANDGQTSYVEVYMKDDKEYTANASTRIRTISIGPNTKYEFTIEVSGDECSHRQYFAVRAFDAAGNASKVEAEELVNVTTVTVQGEETETEGAIYGGGSFTISGEGAEGAEVVTSEDEIPGVEGDEGSILGERTEDEEEVKGEQGFIGKVFSSPWTWIAIIAAVGGIVINGIRKSKK